MANFANLSNGSSGDEVKKLQQALIAKGYDVGASGADGIFGSDTESAVRKYQQDNSLTTDGIAGAQTQGKLYGTSNTGSEGNTNTNTSTNTTTAMGGMSVNTENFGSSDYNNLLNQAFRVTQQGLNSNYNAANDFLNQYLNRDAFSFNINEDAMYNQLKDQYMQQGSLMMEDAMGKAAAMTGGYGNSYAQSVGQQAYNQYMTQLNEMVPELYDMAYDRYNQKGQDMLNMYDLYMGRADVDYERLMDQRDWEYKEEQNAKAEKESKYNKMASLISSTGEMPTAEELAAVGMTESEAKALQNSYFTSLYEEPDYKYWDNEESAKWVSEGRKQETWGGLMSVWRRMKNGNYDPMASAELIKDVIAENGNAIKPSYDELLELGDDLEAAGVPESVFISFIREWIKELGYVIRPTDLTGNDTHIQGVKQGGSGHYLVKPD